MSQMNQNQAATENTKAYHRPQLKKLGNVSEVTQANSGSPGQPSDGGSDFFNSYAS